MKILKIPFNRLFVLIIVFCLIGAYSINSSVWDVGVMVAFGVIGYIMRKAGFESPPLVLAFILGPRMEQSLRQSLLLSQGSVAIFFERPIALGCLILAAVLIIISFSRYTAQKREEMLQEG